MLDPLSLLIGAMLGAIVGGALLYFFTRSGLTDRFHRLSAAALQQNNQAFLDLATQTLGKFQEAAQGDLAQRSQAIGSLLQPVQQSLGTFNERLTEIEKARQGAYQGLHDQVAMMRQLYSELKGETSSLAQALRSPVARGRWGELQLRRVAELAGMIAHCDFAEQVTLGGNTGTDGRGRPDMVVRLPGGRSIVIDAKTPLDAYLLAHECDNEAERQSKFADHARAVEQRVKELSDRGYWRHLQPSPEFAVLFLPGEHFFSAALMLKPGLIENASAQNVIIATPTTLIALLRAVEFGWREHKLAEDARVIADLGLELCNRLVSVLKHFGSLGKALGGAVTAYNSTVGSLEQRTLVTARKFNDYLSRKEELPILSTIETELRVPSPLLLDTVLKSEIEAGTQPLS